MFSCINKKNICLYSPLFGIMKVSWRMPAYIKTSFLVEGEITVITFEDFAVCMNVQMCHKSRWQLETLPTELTHMRTLITMATLLMDL